MVNSIPPPTDPSGADAAAGAGAGSGNGPIPTRKVMLLGDIGVGKTSLSRRFVFNRFEASYKATIGVDIYTREIVLPAGMDRDARASTVKLVIWDIDGDLGESIFNHIYFRGISGCLIVGDVTRRSSWDTMARLAEGMQEAAPGRPALFVLNKMDLNSDFEPHDLPDAIAHSGMELLETSAKNGNNVDKAFGGLVRAILDRGL